MAAVAEIRPKTRGARRAETAEAQRKRRDEGQQAERAVHIEEKLRALVGRLQGIADQQVAKKVLVEERWLLDLRAYHGRYDVHTEQKLHDAKQSRLFVNLSRSKTNAWEARLSDMLFPTDDKNWGIEPTPVPELVGEARRSFSAAQRATEQANAALRAGDATQAAQIAEAGNQEASAAAKAEEELRIAKERAEAMQREIEDQLTEARYNIKARAAIHDMCKLGTGIMKGPLVGAKPSRGWRRVESNVYQLESRTDPRPTFERVDPWAFFPDMDARTVEEAEFTFERHLHGKKGLRKLAKRPGFNKQAIRRLLEQGPHEGRPVYLNQLRDITSAGQTSGMEPQFQVWEYHGPLEMEDLTLLVSALADEKEQQAALDDLAMIDPLEETNVVIHFCQGEVLFFGPHPMDSGESVYSVSVFERDDSCIFGFGVNYLMRDSQAALNAAWRAIMDNGALSAGPQVVINQGVVEPADGNWTLTPRKTWLVKAGAALGPGGIKAAFETFHIDSRQPELAAIVNMARQFADEETNMPLIAQGDQAAHVTQTAQGMAILMNSVNVVFRRVVKNFDDCMTEPNIRRAYDWNMQHSSKEAIKGDMEVKARGSSVLLVREIQAQNLMTMAAQFTAHPVLGPLTKIANLYRRLVQAHMLNSDDIVKSDEDIRREQAEAAKNPPPPDPETLKLQLQREIAKLDSETRLQVAQITRETALVTLAQNSNMKIEELRAMLLDKREDRDSKERIFAAEAAVEERRDARDRAAGPDEKDKGSGGYL